MSVIAANRNLSKCQVVMSAVELKAKIHDLCIRDLGIKNLETVVRKKYGYGIDPYENMPKYVLEIHQAKQCLHYFEVGWGISTKLCQRNNDLN